MRMISQWRLATAVVAASRIAVAGPTPATRCAALEARTMGQTAARVMHCHARALRSGFTADPTCLSAAAVKLLLRFQQAEASGACPAPGNAGPANARVATFANAVVAALGTGGDADADRCAAAKADTAGRKALGDTQCEAKGLLATTAAPSTCVATVEGRFTAAVARTEARLACRTTNDASALAALVAAFTSDVTHLVVTVATTTTTLGGATTTTASTTTSTTTPLGVSFQHDLQPILTSSCATTQCHVGPTPAQDLELTTGRAYAMLVGVPSGQKPTRMRVLAGDPTRSYLVMKLTNARGILGAQMPNVGGPLTPAQIALFSQWITAGAPNN